MAAIFPYLPGLAFPIERSPVWDTTRQMSVSGKSTYFANRTQPRYQYAISISGLDDSGAFASLGVKSKQALEALFNNTNGGASIFYFWDANDSFASQQPFGTGDGTTTAWQLYRTTAGGWNDAIFAPLISAAPVQVSSVFAPNNLLIHSGDLTNAAWGKSNATVTAGAADPFGGTSAQTVTAAAANAFVDQFVTASGSNYVSSLWVRRNTGSGLVKLSDPAHDGGVTTLGLSSAWQRFSTYGAPLSAHATCLLNIATSGDAVDVYGAQVEESTLTTPGIYVPTLSAANAGAPQISVAGVLADPSTYSVSSTGLVTFNTPPANGAALTWTGAYWWPCNFDADTLALSQMMGSLWEAKSIKFTTRIY